MQHVEFDWCACGCLSCLEKGTIQDTHHIYIGNNLTGLKDPEGFKNLTGLEVPNVLKVLKVLNVLKILKVLKVLKILKVLK